jgi:hypothetical protein
LVKEAFAPRKTSLKLHIYKYISSHSLPTFSGMVRVVVIFVMVLQLLFLFLLQFFQSLLALLL